MDFAVVFATNQRFMSSCISRADCLFLLIVRARCLRNGVLVMCYLRAQHVHVSEMHNTCTSVKCTERVTPHKRRTGTKEKKNEKEDKQKRSKSLSEYQSGTISTSPDRYLGGPLIIPAVAQRFDCRCLSHTALLKIFLLNLILSSHIFTTQISFSFRAAV